MRIFQEISKIMMMKKQLFTFLSGFCFVLLYGQQEPRNAVVPDSLFQKTYEELADDFDKYKKDPVRAEAYAKAYLEKSIAGNDTIKRADAYHFLSLINTPSISEKYADSIILFTETINIDPYPARGFLVKATALQRMGKYKEALDKLLEADSLSIVNANEDQELEVKRRIGLLKTDLGEDKEALDIFRAYSYRMEKKYKAAKKSYVDKYIFGLFALGDAYNRTKHYDSATIINKKGFDISSKNETKLIPAYFTLSMGVTAYLKQQYSNSLDSLRKAVVSLKAKNDKGNIMICYFYMGKAYKDQDKMNEAISYFKKIDTIVIETSNVFPEIMEVYTFLRDYYNERGDKNNEVKYTNQLLATHSLWYSNYKYLSQGIKDYDIEQIERENDELIAKIRKGRISWIISLSVIVFFISIFTYYYYRRQRMYRIKFEALLHEEDTPPKKQAPVQIGAEAITGLNISETVIKSVLAKLAVFVDEKHFLNNDVSLNHLAQVMKTNPNYLSKIINCYEQKSFSAYITELRINYVIKELKVSPFYRRYSVKAIAKEVGFNNTQSFSKAFYKKTGMYPSYFIRELEREKLRKLRSSKKVEDKDQNIVTFENSTDSEKEPG